jgi:hypothetical protein
MFDLTLSLVTYCCEVPKEPPGAAADIKNAPRPFVFQNHIARLRPAGPRIAASRIDKSSVIILIVVHPHVLRSGWSRLPNAGTIVAPYQ